MAGDAGSLVVRRQLGARLRQLRTAAGKSMADVTAANLGSKAKLSRIENGQGPVKVADVRALCWLYGASEQVTDALAALAPGTQHQDWWMAYGQAVVPDWFGIYAGLEAAASRIRCFEPEFVHGLLQVEAYARAVVSADDTLTEDVLMQRVRFRMQRQALVLQADPMPDVTIILNEAALVRLVGSPEIMASQLDRLRSAPVDVRVLPFSAGAYPRRGSIALLDFNSPDDPSLAYVEGPASARPFEGEERLPYERVFNTISHRSVSIKEWTS